LEVVLNALTFGVAHLSGQARSLGSGEFEGDTERAGPLKGKVIDAGESVQIEYTVASQTNRVYYSEIPIRSFNANLLPLEYRRYNVQNGRRFELGVGHFAVFEIGSTNLSSSGGYVPSMFQATNSPKELFMISSNAAFSEAESGAMVEVPTVNSAPKAPGDNNVLVIIAGVLLFVACNIVVFLWLISRARNTNRDKHI
jgi:hypothetical protein